MIILLYKLHNSHLLVHHRKPWQIIHNNQCTVDFNITWLPEYPHKNIQLKKKALAVGREMTMLATTSATRLDEKRNTPSGLQSIAASSYQYQRWCLLSVVLAVFAWTQAMSYFAHLNDSIVTSSEFKNATTVASADADSHEVKMKQQGSIDSVLDKVKRIDQKSDGSAARVPQVIWLMSFPNSVCQMEYSVLDIGVE